jgi:hypothetical protein
VFRFFRRRDAKRFGIRPWGTSLPEESSEPRGAPLAPRRPNDSRGAERGQAEKRRKKVRTKAIDVKRVELDLRQSASTQVVKQRRRGAVDILSTCERTARMRPPPKAERDVAGDGRPPRSRDRTIEYGIDVTNQLAARGAAPRPS